MQKKDVEHIRKNYMSLAADMELGCEPIANYLYQQKRLSKYMRDEILCEKTPASRTFKLLDMIIHRGQYAYNSLYQATLHAKCYTAADLLRPENASHDVADEPYKHQKEEEEEVTKPQQEVTIPQQEVTPFLQREPTAITSYSFQTTKHSQPSD